MLCEFISSNRQELIECCKFKGANRFGSPGFRASTAGGVPLFLEQLVEILSAEQSKPSGEFQPELMLSYSHFVRAAAYHGTELFRLGLTVDQVVHEYGDVCQSITQMAIDKDEDISTAEFRTLNRCLDDAIASAVASFGLGRQVAMEDRAGDLHARLEMFVTEQARLVETASQAFSAIRAGGVGTNGATGQLLAHALTELRYLTERTLPQLRSAFTLTAPAE
jgi:hypothetical protein